MKKVAGVAKEIPRGSAQGPDVFAMHGDKHSLRGPLIQSEQDVLLLAVLVCWLFSFILLLLIYILPPCVPLYKKQKILN